MNIAIIDTCSIIRLGKSDILHLLNHLFDEVYIPIAVFNECNNHKETKDFLKSFVYTKIQVSINNELNLNLGNGEKECIYLAIEKCISTIITDDEKAIKKASNYNLLAISTFDIIILLKQFNLISSAKIILDRIVSKNEGISKDEYKYTLNCCKESITGYSKEI